MIEFFVEGTPAPQGSKTAKCVNGRAVMWEASKGAKIWRDTVTAQALIEMIARGHETITTPVELKILFCMPKPKSTNRELPSVKPDLDKLVRNVGDSLTKAGIYQDDALVVSLTTAKIYQEPIGCHILVKEFNNV